MARQPNRELNYATAHAKVKRLFGPASKYCCFFDNDHQGHDWALVKNAVMATWDPDFQLYFSYDADDYIPLCRSCHLIYDHLKCGNSVENVSIIQYYIDRPHLFTDFTVYDNFQEW